MLQGPVPIFVLGLRPGGFHLAELIVGADAAGDAGKQGAAHAQISAGSPAVRVRSLPVGEALVVQVPGSGNLMLRAMVYGLARMQADGQLQEWLPPGMTEQAAQNQSLQGLIALLSAYDSGHEQQAF